MLYNNFDINYLMLYNLVGFVSVIHMLYISYIIFISVTLRVSNSVFKLFKCNFSGKPLEKYLYNTRMPLT